jgi:hypothetical protein
MTYEESGGKEPGMGVTESPAEAAAFFWPALPLLTEDLPGRPAVPASHPSATVTCISSPPGRT